MNMSAIEQLGAQGQSVWLDYIRRRLIRSGDLARLVADGVRGVTSNPSIFEKAIAGSDDYDEELRHLLDADLHAEPRELYDRLAVEDIRETADVLRSTFDETDGDDGYVSLEVSPQLALNTAGTISEARRIWAAVDRPNLMIKVPATPEGVPATEALVAEGINVNATLLFSLARYQEVAEAYVRGLERAAEPSTVASVASFFVSRVDTAVDRQLEADGRPEALELAGSIAIANAKLAYRRYQDIFEGEGFADLRARGGRPQKVLWASTSTKNPAYSDVLYVEGLIGPNTVNTIPPATLEAYREHGRVEGATLTADVDAAFSHIERLGSLGIDLNAITDDLLDEGLEAFGESFHQILHALDEKSRRLRAGLEDRQSLSLGGHAQAVDDRLEAWSESSFVRRLWSKDYTLWSDEPQPEITDRLGWLTLPETMGEALADIDEFAGKARADGFRHVVLMGMGGSSLAPEVYQRTFGSRPGFLDLIVLDSTHPQAVQAVRDRVDIGQTLFLLASKSGTTLEPLSFFHYFWSEAAQQNKAPGHQFIAVTDPGTPLVDLAHDRRFRRVFEAPPDVGGRYSALTPFGLVPAALIGVDLHRLVDRAWRMAEAAAFCVAEDHNPALVLGATLGVLARRGLDKATFLVSPSLAGFPSWIEQLIAESTGKDDTGILPIADEPAGPPGVYHQDRVFVYLSYVGDDDATQAEHIDALEAAGHPVVRIRLDTKEDLGAEMFRAEFAVAAAGAVLGIHPFNQPDVQLAKDLARRAMEGELSAGDVDEIDSADVVGLTAAVTGWLGTAREGDYIALQAYTVPSAETTEALQRIRLGLRDRLKVATTLGYGPRFLHSTGQFHKGGPNTGLFLQLVDEPSPDLDVPETDYSFGKLLAAQALGDYQALKERNRRVLRVQLGAHPPAALNTLEEVLNS